MIENREVTLRIALFTETFLPKIDGVVSILCLVLRRMEELGHEVLVFAPPDSPPAYAGARVIAGWGPRVPLYQELHMTFPGAKVRRELQNFKPDVIHVASPAWLGIWGIVNAKRLKIPLIASFHTNIPQYLEHYGYGWASDPSWRYLRFLHNRAEMNLSTSSYMRDELTRQGFKNVHWWKRGVDTEFFSTGPVDPEMRARLTDGNPDQFLVAYIGRHAREKRLFELKEAFAPLEGVRLAMVGGGPAHEELKAHFAGTPTTFPGYMRGEELIAAYRSADCFVFPSTTETFGLVALEAMACGLPVIAARAGGIVDTVVDGVNGFFFDPPNFNAIGDHVRTLRDDPALRAQLAQNAIDHAATRSWRATMDQLAGFYEQTIVLARESGRVR